MAKMRLHLTKGEEIRYISHLDYAHALERAIRRARLQASYSEGFNPHMKIAFASALAVGVTSEAEYMDVELMTEIPAEEFSAQFKPQLPLGITLQAVKTIVTKQPALMAMVNLATYTAILPIADEANVKIVEQSIATFNIAEQVVYTKETPKGKKEIDIKKYVAEDITVTREKEEVHLFLKIAITPTGSVKPGEVIDSLIMGFGLPVEPQAALIHRRGLYIVDGQNTVSPMDFVG